MNGCNFSVDFVEEAVMSIETRARALMFRHQHMINNRQQCMLSRAAAQIGVPGEAVEAWNQEQGKVYSTQADLNGKRVGVS
jgi:hypothetical protein